MYNKRVEVGDVIAMFNLGCSILKDYMVCNETVQRHQNSELYYHRAEELGFAKAYNYIGYVYDNGQGVEMDTKKANHYL